ncbi:tRNA1(Val) (adenine(37)-N6)-methyltransferase [Liquorilactobacillus sicerae]|uniref:tRNA1(Val) (adenine(37)-N6)-methyltransferase n=1 Tax=Liquorilactobacillus sicerae TaxID=1416943 RepID=UPI00248119DE|nr:tRNA1(Val) (adenine(37)-N6)-methyltransferase [Liquorilactobacillus sicerae]
MNSKPNLNSNERIDQLTAHGVQVIQSPEVFSFSLDAVLIADFCRPAKRADRRIVDLCAGNGAVGLFIAHKTAAQIIEVEIQPRLADMAQRSILLNGLQKQMSVLNLDAKQIFASVAKDSVDTVVCNPPYFPDLKTSKKNPNQYLAIARHEIKINLAQVINISSQLLKMKGKFFLIHRPDRFSEILALLGQAQMAVNQVRLVYPKADRPANMILIEAIKNGSQQGMRFLPPLIVYGQNNQYSTTVRQILHGE